MRWFRTMAAIMAIGIVTLTSCQVWSPSTDTNPSSAPEVSCASLGSASATSATSTLTSTSPTAAPTDTVTVHTGQELGPTNPKLGGLVWNTGSSLDALKPIHPTLVRIDGSLQSASPAPGQLDLTNLLGKVKQVRQVGAEPLVILSYMPRWLGQARAGTGDPTRFAPSDMDAWQALVTQVVRTLATAQYPAYEFEVWNEPDISIFWADTPEAFAETAVRTTRAVAQVKAETGLPLKVGGPASAFVSTPTLSTYVQAVAAEHLPLDFISWHHYANSPWLGPDGPEGNLPLDVYQALAKRNPNSSPLDYSNEIAQVRAKVGSLVQGTDLSPELIIDEWNVSAGGYDLRNDTAEGASLDAGILMEMERAGLSEAAIYRAVSGSDNHPGDWGIVYADGTPKPIWWVFRAWHDAQGTRLNTTGADGTTGLFARATRHDPGGCTDVLLANFVATGGSQRTVKVAFDGKLPFCAGRRTITLSVLNSTSTSLAGGSNVRLDPPDQATTIKMAPQSVALLRTGCVRS